MIATKHKGIVIHKFTVKNPHERKSFQILLPGDCEEITGILVLPDPGLGFLSWAQDTSEWNDNIAGHISFRYNGPGDVFFMEKAIVESDFDIYRVIGLDPPNKEFPDLIHAWTNGRKYSPRKVNIPGSERVITGYYKDVMNFIAGVTETYTVSIYLFYERKRPPQDKQRAAQLPGNHVSDHS